MECYSVLALASIPPISLSISFPCMSFHSFLFAALLSLPSSVHKALFSFFSHPRLKTSKWVTQIAGTCRLIYNWSGCQMCWCWKYNMKKIFFFFFSFSTSGEYMYSGHWRFCISKQGPLIISHFLFQSIWLSFSICT